MHIGFAGRAGGKSLSWSTGVAVLSGATLAPDAAAAYVGPGAGLSVIGSAVAFLGVVLLLFAGFAWYPIKRLMRRLRGAPATGHAAAGGRDS